MKRTQFLKLEDAVKVAASHFDADKEIAEREFEQKCYMSDDQYGIGFDDGLKEALNSIKGLQDKTWSGELPRRTETPHSTVCDEVEVILAEGYHAAEFRFSDGTIKRVNIAKFDEKLTKRDTAAAIMKKVPKQAQRCENCTHDTDEEKDIKHCAKCKIKKGGNMSEFEAVRPKEGEK